MIAGLPGTGIGGLFYLLIAIVMPIQEFYLKIRKKDDKKRWQIVKKHFLLTICIVIGVLITGYIIGMIIEIIISPNANTGDINTNIHIGNINTNIHTTENVIRISTLLFTLLTLIVVYLSMRILGIIFKLNKTFKS